MGRRYKRESYNATDAPLAAVMTATLVGVIQPNSGEDARLAGIWTQQFTGTDRQYSGYDAYNISSADFDWDGPYYSVTQQANISIAKSREAGRKRTWGRELGERGWKKEPRGGQARQRERGDV